MYISVLICTMFPDLWGGGEISNNNDTTELNIRLLLYCASFTII